MKLLELGYFSQSEFDIYKIDELQTQCVQDVVAFGTLLNAETSQRHSGKLIEFLNLRKLWENSV